MRENEKKKERIKMRVMGGGGEEFLTQGSGWVGGGGELLNMASVFLYL